jgi:hypothetical protein
MLEGRIVEYITGAAMMEPDIRIRTNKEGFCLTHYRAMLARRNRLGVALMLQSHLDEVEKQLFGGLPLVGRSAKKAARGAEKQEQSCFICREVDEAMVRLLDNLCAQWEEQADFRRLWEDQPLLCLPHLAQVCAAAERCLPRDGRAAFEKTSRDLAKKALEGLQQDVEHFCRMFDYRNSGGEGADWGNARDAIERSVAFLTGREL